MINFKKLPQTLGEFRLGMAELMEECKFPSSLVAEVRYLDLEGGEVFLHIFDGWTVFEDFYENSTEKELRELSWDDFDDVIIDTAYSVCSAWNNPWNHPPEWYETKILLDEASNKITEALKRRCSMSSEDSAAQTLE